MSRKHPSDSKQRMSSVDNGVVLLFQVTSGTDDTAALRSFTEQRDRQLAEKTHVELMGPGGLNATTYNEACRVAAERLEEEHA